MWWFKIIFDDDPDVAFLVQADKFISALEKLDQEYPGLETEDICSITRTEYSVQLPLEEKP
jgi:hypothetical protein